jgi:hypothetical protein
MSKGIQKYRFLRMTLTGFVVGILGALLMSYLMTDPFKLYYLGGYVLLFVVLLIPFMAIVVFLLFSREHVKYWNKVYVGFLSFIVMEIFVSIFQSSLKSIAWGQNDVIIILVVGLIFALLFARILKK